MNEKQRIIGLVKIADITKDDWDYMIIQSISDLYARGYIQAYKSIIGNILDSHQEDYRDELLKVFEWNIWNVK